MALPTFIVVGAAKCGTTSLFRYLQQHPDIFLPESKELNYFSSDILYRNTNGVGDKDTLSTIVTSREDYEKVYRYTGRVKAIGDVSPSYLYNKVHNRIYSELGAVKIVVMLRNPVEKAYSQYMHLVRDQREKLGFYEALMAEAERTKNGWSDIWRYADSSKYSGNLYSYIDVFGRENVHVILFNEFKFNTGTVLNNLFAFLGIAASGDIDFSKQHNRSGVARFPFVAEFMQRPSTFKAAIKVALPARVRMALRLAIMDINTASKPAIDPKSQEYLRKYFEDDNEQLAKMLGTPSIW